MARLVVIGGVAAGTSAASRAKRRRPDWDVVVLERGRDVSYGACGIPYNVEDPHRRIDDLVVVTAEQFRQERGIDVRTRQEALALSCRSGGSARRLLHTAASARSARYGASSTPPL